MATTSEIAEVRANTDEPRDSEEFTKEIVELLVDESGVNAASAIIWRRKAAGYAKLVNTSEAGASHSFGELQDKALKMATLYEHMAEVATASSTGSGGRVRVHLIERD